MGYIAFNALVENTDIIHENFQYAFLITVTSFPPLAFGGFDVMHDVVVSSLLAISPRARR
jgi:hypothetical protein